MKIRKRFISNSCSKILYLILLFANMFRAASKFLLLAFVILSCDKENLPEFSLDCQQLRNGILNSDKLAIGNEISKLTPDLTPVPVSGDNIGHSANLETLIRRLNQCEEISAQTVCYACIDTYPPQSEIIITTITGNREVLRVIDIKTPANGSLEFISVHE